MSSNPVNPRDMQSEVEVHHYTTGYLAFVHPPAPDLAINVGCAHRHPQGDDDVPPEELQVVEHPLKDDILRREQTRQTRAESEREEAMKGDIDWVKFGGVLRDQTGKRDFERTNMIRKELERQALERTVLDGWNAYEHRWNTLLTSREPLTFSTIPWPVAVFPTHVNDLTIRSIAHFVIAPLQVTGSTVARRHRIRQLILRYHPDKISPVITRTVNTDKSAVEEGILIVLACLKHLHDEEKATEPLP